MLSLIIWSGWGLVVPLIVGVVSFTSSLVFGLVDEQYYDTGLSLGVILSAVVIWFVGKYLNERTGRRLVDPETGEDVILRPATSSLFFVPVQWWGPLLAISGIALLLGGVD